MAGFHKYKVSILDNIQKRRGLDLDNSGTIWTHVLTFILWWYFVEFVFSTFVSGKNPYNTNLYFKHKFK